MIRGGRRLEGTVTISGAKNAALPELFAALLSADPVTIRNLPRLHDVRTAFKLLGSLGVAIDHNEARPDVVTLRAGTLTSREASYDLVKTMRASILVLGPLLARFGEARVSLPGGCEIGLRPVDQHIKGLQAMGAEITVEHGYIVAKAARLKGARITTDMVTVTGTENLLMAATLAEGETILENAAQEPEIPDLAEMLIGMGAKIEGHGTSRIRIEGVERLHGVTHTVIPDRIETGTFLCAVAAGGRHRAQKGTRFDAVGDDGVAGAMQFGHALDHQAVGADAFDLRTHLDQQVGQVGDFRLARGVLQDRLAFGQGGGHQQGLGAGHGDHVGVDARALELFALGVNVAAFDGDLGAQRLQTLDVLVHRA